MSAFVIANRIMEVVVFTIAALCIIYSAWRVKRYKKDWPFFLPIITLAAHHLVFYSVQIIASHTGVGMSILLGIPNISQTWSLVLRLHSLMTLIALVYIFTNIMRSCEPWKTTPSKQS